MDDPLLVAVDAWIEKARDRQDRVLRAIAEDCLARVKELTPVKTGYLRANWVLMKGGSAEAIAGARAEDSVAVVLTLKAGDAFTIANPVVYARRIEFGFVGTDARGRTYDQPGSHMMQQVITELPQISAAAAARIAQL